MKSKLQVCSKCNIAKPLDSFYKRRDKYERRKDCIECQNKRCQAYYEKHKDKFLMYNRKHRKLKPEEYKSYQESYRQENAEKIRTLSFNYYQQNTELIKDKNYTYRIQRLQDDPIYRLIDCYRTRVRNALKSQIKSEKTMDLIGCTADFLRKWIEAKWVLGMNWSNYGYGKDKWNVDHIIPCASFDRSKESERRKCFHYTNLQPLWQIDNFAKAAKLNYEH